MSPRWTKVFHDLVHHRGRTALVVLCIAVGVIAVGLIEGARQILANNLDASFQAAQPATIALSVPAFDSTLLNVVRRIPGVQATAGRTIYVVRVQTRDGTWRDLQLFAASDFTTSPVNRLLPVEGIFPPPANQIALERSSIAFLGVAPGDSLTVELPGGKQTSLPIAGVAHDLNQASTFLTGAVYGYVTPATLTALDLPTDYNQLLIRTDAAVPRSEIATLATTARTELESRGYLVTATVIPAIPGRLFFADSVQSMMLLLGAMGLASLFSSAILVVTTMFALLAQQIREVGVMKAIGAPAGALVQMYLATVVIYSLIAIAIAIPLGALGAYLLVIFSTDILNLLPVSFTLVPSAVLLQIFAGLLIPLLAALVPVLSGTRITVRQAITSYGLGGGNFGTGRIDRLVEKFRALPRPLLLSLRNCFRRKGRLALTVATLTISGAVFMAVLSVRESLFTTLEQMDKFRHADIDLVLAAPQRIVSVERAALNVPGVTRVESWGWGEADMRPLAAADGERLEVFGVPEDSRALEPTLLQGRWFVPGDMNAIVLDADVLKTNPALTIGDLVVLNRSDSESIWQIVGFTRSRLRGPLAYVPYDAWTRTQHEGGLTQRLAVFTSAHDAVSQAQISRALEMRLKENDQPVLSTQTASEARASDLSNFDSIIGFLTAMGVLLAVVGGLGLAGTMGINVLERTREIGVLRAIGAPTPSLLQIVVVEGILIGVMSFPFAVLLSLPLANLLNELVGRQLLQASLAFAFSWYGLLIWFLLVILIAIIASLVPAYNAIRLTVRSALAYE